MKVLNVKGIIILVVLFLAVQFLTAFILSPVLAPIVIENINTAAGAKISVEKITIWPLTLSFSLKNLKVFDPDNENMRIALIKNASIRISPLALLSKRLVIAKFGITDAEIDLKGEEDGSFNVAKLARPKEGAKAKGSIFDRFRKKGDWFGRIYDGVKQKFSEKGGEKEEKAAVKGPAMKREIKDLPRGRRVNFLKPKDTYVFEISSLVVKNSNINVQAADGQEVDIEKAVIYIEDLGLDPAAGARFSKLGASGSLKKNEKLVGRFNLDYAQSLPGEREAVNCSLSAKDIDLTAIKFVYGDSLPVDFEKGIISVDSHTKIVSENLDSDNSVILKAHTILPKNKQEMVGLLPLPVVCDALNKVDPLKIRFKITGTVTNPQFKGFEQVLLDLIKPYVADIQKNLQEKGMKAIGELFQKKGDTASEAEPSGEDSTKKAIESFKSLFGDQSNQ